MIWPEMARGSSIYTLPEWNTEDQNWLSVSHGPSQRDKAPYTPACSLMHTPPIWPRLG